MSSVSTLDALPISTTARSRSILPPPPISLGAVETMEPMAPTVVGGLSLLKEDESLIIGGYASVEMVDREKHFIPLETLEQAFDGFMKDEP